MRETKRRSTSRRTVPSQARAKQTVDELLETAARLLTEDGIGAFNTNRLAEEAGVTVPTVYRYFPNKEAVIEALAERLVADWDRWFDDTRLADPQQDWRTVWSAYVDAFVAGIDAAPAGPAIRNAIHSRPELRDLEERDTAHLSARLTRALQRRAPHLAPAHVRDAAELLLTTAISAIDRAFVGSPRKRARRIEALKTMQIAYLATLLEDDATT